MTRIEPRLSIAVLAIAMLIATAPATTSTGAQTPADAGPGISEPIETDLIVSFDEEVPDDLDTWASQRSGQVQMASTELAWAAISFPDEATADAAAEDARDRSDVERIEHDGRIAAHLVPDDPLYGDQWGFPAINAPDAWNTTRGSHEVTVAVLDTGVDTQHPDLAGNLCGPHRSFAPSEPTVDPRGAGHGTHTSGTVGAVTDNGLGVAGTSASCLMHGKVLASSGGGQWSWLARGIEWAALNGADVISMSLGGGFAPDIVEEAVHLAYTKTETLLVASAGNAGCAGSTLAAIGPGNVGYPALYDEVVAVAATSTAGTVAPYSSCGAPVEVAAPGTGVLSTLPGGSYGSLSGTSMAAPHVAGVAALLEDAYPEITPVETRCVLRVTAEDISYPGRDHYAGWGEVDAAAALEGYATMQALSESGPPDACGAGPLLPVT